MTAATAQLLPDQARPPLRAVRPPLDRDALAAQWEVAFNAAERALTASAQTLEKGELSARRQSLLQERLAVVEELRRFAAPTRAAAAKTIAHHLDEERLA